MAGIRQIFQRLRAVENICRVTRTMEMVSTAKYRAYHNRRTAIVEYHDALARAGYLLVTPQVPIEHPLLKENSSGRSAILAIGSTKGLCGAYNDYICRLVQVHVYAAKEMGRKLDIYAPARRLVSTLNYHGIIPTKIYHDLDEIPSDIQIDEIAGDFVEQYMKGSLDYFGIVYMRYYSASSQHAQTLTILPLTELIDDLATRATSLWPWELSFEDFYLSPSAAEVIEGLAKMMIHSSIETCFMDAAISEHLARMVAMRNATDNAEEMIRELTSEYNRERQSQITGELLDIIGGSEALR
jgi:F-type H+-transporting ATPase subunit gamma